MSNDKVIFVKEPEFLTRRAINQSFGACTRKLVFRANWAEPRMSRVAFVMLLSLLSLFAA